MRKLAWFTLGFALGMLGLTTVLWGLSPWLGLVLLALGALASLASRRRSRLSIPAAVLLGVAAAWGWMGLVQARFYTPLKILDGQIGTAEILALDYGEETDYGQQVKGRIYLEGKGYTLRACLKEGLPVEPGNRLTGEFRFRLTLPGGEKESGYDAASGIFLRATARSATAVEPGQAGSLRFFPQRLAKRMKGILRGCLPEDVFPFAQSLLLGDSEELDYGTKTALTVSGIRHIIAVSGLHVGVLWLLIRRLTGNRRYLTALVGIPAVALFAALVGFTPSVCRAGLMAGLMMLAACLGREYDPLTELSLAALVLLVFNPFTVLSAGFQLSVLSVLGILLFARPIQKKLEEVLWPRLAGPIALTLSAMSLSTPLAACYFGVVSLVGVVTNLLVLPLVTLIFYGVGAVCALGGISPMLGGLLGRLLAWPIRLVLVTARLLGRVPFGALYPWGVFHALALAGIYVLLIFYALFHKGRLRYYVAASAALAAAWVFLGGWLPRQEDFRLAVLDVGQGQSLVLSSRGQTLVIDCGGRTGQSAADRAAEYLLSQNIYRVDALALTHFDEDHAGGVEYLLSRVKAQTLLLPEGKEERAIPFGAGTLRLFPYTGGNSRQENSMAILFESENCVILVTGDLDQAGERRLVREGKIPQTDILVVGHHGSRNAASEELMAAARPKVAVISAGADNPFGHPHQEALDRLERAGAAVFRTDQSGTIVIRR